MQGTVQANEMKPQERINDDFYKVVVERLEVKKSKDVTKDDFLIVHVRTLGGKELSFPMSMIPTLKNNHGRFLKAINAELYEGMKYNTDTYVGCQLEIYFEWDDEKKRMKADKFRSLLMKEE